MNRLHRFWHALSGRDPRDKESMRRHHEVMKAVGENRQAIQNLESTVRIAVRDISSPHSKSSDK